MGGVTCVSTCHSCVSVYVCVYLLQLVAMCLSFGDSQGECDCVRQCRLWSCQMFECSCVGPWLH